MNISYLNDLKCKQTDLVKTLKWGDFRAQHEFFSGLGRVACIPQKNSLKSPDFKVLTIQISLFALLVIQIRDIQ